MKLNLVFLLIIYGLSLVVVVRSQEPTPTPFKLGNERKLPSLTEGNIVGEKRDLILKGFCDRRTDCDQYLVKKIDLNEHLSGVKIYSVAKLNHYFEYVLRYKNKSYLTINDKDFARFLRDFKIIEKLTLLTDFLQVYKYFKLKNGAINPFYIVSQKYLDKYSADLKIFDFVGSKIPFESIKIPHLSQRNNKEIEINFFLHSPLLPEIKRMTVFLSPNYKFRENAITQRIEK